MQIRSVFLLFIIISALNLSISTAQEKLGTLKGVVTDYDTKEALAGVNVQLMGTEKGTVTDLEGKFTIPNVPAGSYNVELSFIGYSKSRQTDVIIRPARITTLQVELSASEVEKQEVVVKAGYFSQEKDQPVSATSFNYEEIRRAPGSAGDISRIIAGLPSIAKVDDQSNSLIVRGGSPIENAFFLDNIEIPNINHFPTQGSSGGPLGLLNVDFIQNVNFSSGGFTSFYGDRLSSIMEITFREGNRNEYDNQLDLNFTGFGGVSEGPLGRNASWMVSLRRSYLDLLIKTVDAGTSIAPTYGDFQGKIVYDINKNNKLSLLWISGDDHSKSNQKAAFENDMIYYGKQDIFENTAGLNWRRIWGSSGYSNTSIAYTSTKYKEDNYESGSAQQIVSNNSLEQVIKFRNVNHLKLDRINSIEFGVDLKYLISDYDNRYFAYTDATGNPSPEFLFDKKITSTRAGIFLNNTFIPFEGFTMNMGVRADYQTDNDRVYTSPRINASYQLTSLLNIYGAYGLFYQGLPEVLKAQKKEFELLKNIQATHYILGISYLLTEDTKLTLEAYEKDYSNFPVNPAQPALFMIDELFYRYGFFFNQENLVDKGRAYSRGIELTVQKKLASDFYGMASASFFRTRYKGYDGEWRDRVFDNQIMFSIEGGYKPNEKWEFSARWIFAGGRPYTPFNESESYKLNRSVLDDNRTNSKRYPEYHSLNLRVDRRFNFSGSNLVAYVSVWNVYNRKNVSSYFWNQKENRQDIVSQWGVMPIFGLEYEF